MSTDREEAERLRALLREMEWRGNVFADIRHPALAIRVCPDCANSQINGHGPDCELAAEIGEPK